VQRLSKTLSLERKARLEVLPGWSWTPFLDKWEEGFTHLKEFAERERHSNVPTFFEAKDGYRLGQWVGAQRTRKASVTPEHKARLEALPNWSWNALSTRWEEGFSYLKEYTNREGHATVPSDYKSADGYRLGQWVGVQRVNRVSTSPERKLRLEALPSWSWDVLSDKWETGFSSLNEFVAREGHAKVPNEFQMSDGYRLGQWVGVQRTTKDQMAPEYQVRLEAMPGWTWDARATNWEEGFSCLQAFANREGHAKVPTIFKSADGYFLGQWVAVQRTTKDKISPERKAQLEALPGWVWRVKA
jgi:Helicase associated domain